MSWQLYHENIMSSIIRDFKLGEALGPFFSRSVEFGKHERNGLVVAGFAALNGATTITSILSGAYGDFDKEAPLAKVFYNADGYRAIGYCLTTFFVVAGEDYMSAIAYGLFPIMLYALSLVLNKTVRSYPEELGYMTLVAKTAIGWLLIGSLLSGVGNPKLFLQVISILEVISSMVYIFNPETIYSKFKYTKDPITGAWIQISEGPDALKAERRDATLAAIVDNGYSKLTVNTLNLALSFKYGEYWLGLDSIQAVGFSAAVHAACLIHDMLDSKKKKKKIYALPREIYLAVALFVAWNSFLSDLI